MTTKIKRAPQKRCSFEMHKDKISAWRTEVHDVRPLAVLLGIPAQMRREPCAGFQWERKKYGRKKEHRKSGALLKCTKVNQRLEN